MIGLPATGKTTWASNYIRDTGKNYNILSTDLILDQMRVYNMRRQGNFKERFDRLMKMASKSFNELLQIAKTKNRNYVLDQTNVFERARSRKIGTFRNWGRKVAAVCIPTMADYQKRQALCAAKNKIVPPEVVANFKKNFVIPRADGREFNEVIYTDTKPPEADRILQQLQQEGRSYQGGGGGGRVGQKRGRDDSWGNSQSQRQRTGGYQQGGYNQ